jgi:hypothetical protein
MPVEGRSNHRLKALRRYFHVICDQRPDALSDFDRLVAEQKRLESLRSSIAHGITLGGEKNGEFTIGAWAFSKADDPKPARETHISEYSFAQIQAARNDIDAVRQGFAMLVERYTKPFIFNTVAMAAAKS